MKCAGPRLPHRRRTRGLCLQRAGETWAVVGDALKVRGFVNLRVVDASVLPNLIGGNIDAAVIMIAERASNLILGKPLIAPAGFAEKGLC